MTPASGTEGQPSCYAQELALASRKMVTEVKPVEPGQQVLIAAHTASDPRVVQATAEAALAVGWVPAVKHCTL